MGTRSQGWALACVLVLAGTAYAAPKDDIEKQAKAAMDAYDGMDYDSAKKSLTTAIQAAKKAKLDKDPLYAKVHLYLGIAAFAAGDADGAKAAFTVAAAVDPKIQIEPAYRQPELVKLLDSVRPSGSVDPGGGGEPTNNGVDCSTVKGLQHQILDTGTAGADQAIEAYLASDVTAAKVAVMYRTEGTTDFVEKKLTKQGGCKYVGAIPAAAMKGALIHYYVAAYNDNNRVIEGANRGSSGSPNIMELTAKAAGGGGGKDNEIPKGVGGGGTPSGGAVSGGVVSGGKAPKVFIAVAGGTGFGYVTGLTEANNEV
jgi:hypothetical protein